MYYTLYAFVTITINYYYYYYHYYHYYCISTQAISNYEAGADWLSLHSLSPLLSNHRLRKGNTQRGEKASSPFLSSTPPPSPRKLAPATQAMIGPTLEPGGERPGAREIKVRLCNDGFSGWKMRKSRHLCKFQTMVSSSLRKLHYDPL